MTTNNTNEIPTPPPDNGARNRKKKEKKVTGFLHFCFALVPVPLLVVVAAECDGGAACHARHGQWRRAKR